MAGTAGRSGGRNAKRSSNAIGDGTPISPRALSPRATALFSWLVDKLDADDPKSNWHRIDGALLASLAEVMESQERIASMIADDPSDLALYRLRNQFAQQVVRMSALVGLSPFDRARQPAIEPEQESDDPLASIMERMARGQ